MKFIDLTGKTFGKLTVVNVDHKEKSERYWYCKCSCGGDRIVSGRKLREQKITHCGCENKRPSNFVDLTGKTFGNLVVLEEYHGNDKDRVHWVCQCSCDNSTKLIAPTYSLTSGKTTKCKKCLAEETSDRCLKDLTGMRFGRLIVTGRAPNYISPNGNTNTRWKCRCECGNDTIVSQSGLRSQGVMSCGCYRNEVISSLKLDDLRGQRFGKLTVIDRAENIYHPNGSYSVVWNCRCDCGGYVKVQSGNLKNGHTTSCGCILSKGESRIKQYLINNNINYEPQFSFEDCVYIGLLRFDFAIFDNNCNLLFLCEYDGNQHYEPIIFGDCSYEEAIIKYKELVKRDTIKNNYCKEHGIKLLRIPYWEYDNIENIIDEYIEQAIR